MSCHIVLPSTSLAGDSEYLVEMTNNEWKKSKTELIDDFYRTFPNKVTTKGGEQIDYYGIDRRVDLTSATWI